MTVVSEPNLVLTGRYRLDAPLAQGRDGWFCQAHDLVLGRSVTVKMFKSTLTDETAARTFAVQAKALVGLRHDYLVTLLDGGVADGHPYLVLEPVDGFGLLDDTPERQLSASETATIGAGLADALAHMHEKGVVHGHLTRASVLVDADGRWRLVGGGFDPARDNTDHADVRALGDILLTCLDGEDIGKVPWQLTRVLAAMTRPDPQRRPSTAVCARQLSQAASTLEAGHWAPTRAAMRRGRIVGLAVGGLVTAGVVAVALVPTSSQQQTVPPAAAPAPTTTSSQVQIPDPTVVTTTPRQPVVPPPVRTSRPPAATTTTSAPLTTSASPTTTSTSATSVYLEPTGAAPTTVVDDEPPGLAKKPYGLPPGLLKKLIWGWNWGWW